MAVQPGNWSIFGILDNIWSFGGSDNEDINMLNFQYQAYAQVGYNIVKPDATSTNCRFVLALQQRIGIT